MGISYIRLGLFFHFDPLDTFLLYFRSFPDVFVSTTVSLRSLHVGDFAQNEARFEVVVAAWGLHSIRVLPTKVVCRKDIFICAADGLFVILDQSGGLWALNRNGLSCHVVPCWLSRLDSQLRGGWCQKSPFSDDVLLRELHRCVMVHIRLDLP